MTKDPTHPLISQKYIRELLVNVLADESAEIKKWSAERLQGGLEIGSSIHRLKGTAIVNGEEQSWSFILKIIMPNDETDDPQGYRYWKREVLAYQSGVLHDLPGKVTAPACYAVEEQPDGSFWLWLEDVKDEMEHPWSVERYKTVARILGRFNGAYLENHPLPKQDWLTHDWLRKYLDHAAPMVEFIHQNPGNTTVNLMLPGISLPMTLATWKESERILKVLEKIPQVFCHQDSFGRNLFFRNGHVIAIDWGYAGIAPIGAELAPLIGASFGLAKFPSNLAKELDQACFEGYLEGLEESGWNPDPKEVRLGFTLTMVLRYIFGATIGEALPGLLDEATRDHWIDGLGTSEEKAGETDPGIAAFYQSINFEALKLLGPWFILRLFLRTAYYAIRLIGKRSPV